jgi:GAF domain
LSQHTFEKLIPIAEAKLMQLMGVQKARVMFKHPLKNILFNVAEDGTMKLYPMDCGVAGKVMQTGEFENLTNGYANPLFNGQVDIETSMPLLVYPIKNFLNEKVVGVMEVINSRGIQGLSSMQKANITKNDIETIEFLSKQLAQAALNCLDWEKAEAKSVGKISRFDE